MWRRLDEAGWSVSVDSAGGPLRTFALIAAMIVLAALVPARALATPLDTSSDHAALTAYERYMTSLSAGVAAADHRDDAFAASVQKRCAGVLAPVSALPSDQVSRAALVDLGKEIRDDAAVEFDGEAVPAFTRISTALGRLRWSSSTTANTIAALIAAMRASLAIKPSGLCADAQAVASAPASEPVRTWKFLAVYVPAARARAFPDAFGGRSDRSCGPPRGSLPIRLGSRPGRRERPDHRPPGQHRAALPFAGRQLAQPDARSN
jgi:hypothetical protein